MATDPSDEGGWDGEEETTSVVRFVARTSASASPSRHLLVCTEGSHLGRVVRLPDAGEVAVGRSADCALRLDEPGVSRRHALVQRIGERYLLRDLQSANGTFVQGERIEQTLLQDGDLVEFGPSAAFRYTVSDAKHERMLRDLHQARVTDTLTGVGNRHHFDTQLAAEVAYARRHGTALALLLVDVDHFKRVNDTWGHPVGDAVLREVCQAVRGALRAEDTLARYGGEEFAVLLRDVGVDGARAAAERVRQAVSARPLLADGPALRVTVSIGCATLAEAGPDALVPVADRRLYAAKAAGRDRVVAGE